VDHKFDRKTSPAKPKPQAPKPTPTPKA
jgi:hypothetical protein